MVDLPDILLPYSYHKSALGEGSVDSSDKGDFLAPTRSPHPGGSGSAPKNAAKASTTGKLVLARSDALRNTSVSAQAQTQIRVSFDPAAQ